MRLVGSAFVVGVVLLALAPRARGELLVSPERVWAVESPRPAEQILEYLACDSLGERCVAVGVGDATMLGAPLAVDHRSLPIGTLRARWCRPTPSGSASAACGPMSAPSTPFRLAAELSPPMVISIPSEEDWLSSNPLAVDGMYRLILPLPASAPVSAMLRLWFQDAPGPAVTVLLLSESRPLQRHDCSPCSGPVSLNVRDALTDALRTGAREIEVRLIWTGGPGRIGAALPGSAGAEAPHLRLALWPREPFDSDRDGVRNDGDRSGDPGDAPCAPGRWVACDDNCGTAPNAAQADADGDGFGDACDPSADPARNALGGPLVSLSPVDCMLEWRYAREDLPLDAQGVVSSEASCRDGDRGCDLDGVPGRCTLAVGVCLNVRDPRMPACAPEQVTRLAFSLSSDTGSNGAEISGLVRAAELPNAESGACGPFASLVVPVADPLVVFGYAQGYTAVGSILDNDSLTLACLP